MIERRDLLKLALGGALARVGGEAIASPANAQTPPAAPAEPQPFSFATVVDLARAFSKRGYKTSAPELPDAFANLNYETYVGIRARREAMLWANENIGFAVEPLHRGFIFSNPIQINTVEDGRVTRLIYDATKFDFGKLTPPQGLGDIAFSGFRLHVVTPDGPPTEVAIFQGASFFRAIARGQTMGTMARGLALRVADAKGEEFPQFRAVWIEKPTLAAGALVLYALLDSESLTGAYRFTLRPGDATIIDTECTLFARVAVDHVGIAPMAATSYLSPMDRRRVDDIRPIVAETNGLQMWTGSGEWLWRPVANREALQLSSFVDDKPKGFGMLQRNRDFSQYQDDVQHWEMRPSLWIAPIGEWGPGSVQLVEIPSESEVNDNIISYWRPRDGLAAGSETMFAYRQFWCWQPPERPPAAVVAHSRSGRGSSGKRRRFIVQFLSDAFAEPHRLADLRPVLHANPGAVTALQIHLMPDWRVCRVVFEIDPGGETYSVMRLVLEAGGKQISETWLYRWTP